MAVAAIAARRSGVVIHIRIVYGPFILTGVSIHMNCFSLNVVLTSADIIEYSLRSLNHTNGKSIISGSGKWRIIDSALDTIKEYLHDNSHLVAHEWCIIHDNGVDKLLNRLADVVNECMW